MGYHVNILRFTDGKELPIPEDEVRDAVALMNGRLLVSTDKGELELFPPQQGPDGEVVWYSDGLLWANNPSDDLVTRMIELAGLFGARVQGMSWRPIGLPMIHTFVPMTWRSTRKAAYRQPGLPALRRQRYAFSYRDLRSLQQRS